MKLARIALGYAAAMAFFLLLALPPFWLATSMERIRFGVTSAVIITAIWAIISLTRRRPVGIWLTVGLGTYGAAGLLMHTPLLRHAAAEPGGHLHVMLGATHWLALVLAAIAVLIERSRRSREIGAGRMAPPAHTGR